MSHRDRSDLLKDSEYFASELVRRLECLADIERSGRTLAHWQQAAAVTRRVRALVRFQADEGRRKAKRKALCG